MKTRTKTAPACPDKAVRVHGEHELCREVARHSEAKAYTAGAPAPRNVNRTGFDFGSIPRAEMRQIVLEMIG